MVLWRLRSAGAFQRRTALQTSPDCAVSTQRGSRLLLSCLMCMEHSGWVVMGGTLELEDGGQALPVDKNCPCWRVSCLTMQT